jgi:transposase
MLILIIFIININELFMFEKRINDVAWNNIYQYLRTLPKIHAADEMKMRKFFEGVHWVMRTGAQWRMLPSEYGKWNGVWQRFDDWSKKGVWQQLFEHFSSDRDLEFVMIDATITRAHACSGGAKKGEKIKH